MAIEIRVTDSGARAALERFVARTSRLREPFTRIGRDLSERVRLGFRSGASPFGERWRPLAPSTIAKKRRGGASARPLIDTGALRNSISFRADERSVEIGSDRTVSGGISLAAIHQFGTSRIPARPIFPTERFPIDWEADIENALNRYIFGR